MKLTTILVLLAAATEPSGAYVLGPKTMGRTTSISVGYAPIKSRPLYSPRRHAAATIALPSVATQKNPFQGMLDLYCKFIWIARPDLFLYDRLARMAWDNISKTLKQLEDDKLPENVLNKALQEMQNDLSKIQKAYEDVADTQRRMLAQKFEAEGAADEWYRRAQFALSRGQEQTARNYLYRRQELLDGVNKLQADIEAQDETREKLFEAFQNLEATFREKVAKRQDLMERAKTAQSMTKINELLNAFNSKRMTDKALDTLEVEVEKMEAAAETLDWFKGMSDDERLKMEFAKLAAEERMSNGQNFTRRSSQTQESWIDDLLRAPRY